MVKNKLIKESIIFCAVLLFILAGAAPGINGNTIKKIVSIDGSLEKTSEDFLLVEKQNTFVDLEKIDEQEASFNDVYNTQWAMNFGSDDRYGARYEGPQPIGDCDNDGLNEFLVGGRDAALRVFEWDDKKMTYVQNHTLRNPYYPFSKLDAGGFAIGDLTDDGLNEIAATWPATIYKWTGSTYNILGFNSYVFDNGGSCPDCLIGDYDDDGHNELILSCGSWDSSFPEIVVLSWNGLQLVKEVEWDDPGVDGYVYMAGIGDIDEDGKNEIVCGSANKVVVLDWDSENNLFIATNIKYTGGGWENYPFACVCKDSDMDGKNEIHVGYYSPKISIFEWNGVNYGTKFEKVWPGEGELIEGLDVGDADNDGDPEVCAGTDLVHILGWNGTTYVEEAMIPTFGSLAVVSVGDCDNDGLNELHAGSVMVEGDDDYMSWVFKHEPGSNYICYTSTGEGSLRVVVKGLVGLNLNSACVAAWNLETSAWYDIQPLGVNGLYTRDILPDGEYVLRVVCEGYKTAEDNIIILAGEETSYTFNLKRSTSNYYIIAYPRSNVINQIHFDEQKKLIIERISEIV